MKRILTLMTVLLPFDTALSHESIAPHRHLAGGTVSFEAVATPLLWLFLIAVLLLLARRLTK
jgi:hypothetical protein